MQSIARRTRMRAGLIERSPRSFADAYSLHNLERFALAQPSIVLELDRREHQRKGRETCQPRLRCRRSRARHRRSERRGQETGHRRGAPHFRSRRVRRAAIRSHSRPPAALRSWPRRAPCTHRRLCCSDNGSPAGAPRPRRCPSRSERGCRRLRARRFAPRAHTPWQSRSRQSRSPVHRPGGPQPRVCRVVSAIDRSRRRGREWRRA